MGMKAIPVAVRERILKLYDQGRGTTEIAASFGYCVAANAVVPNQWRCSRHSLPGESRR